MEWPLVDCLRKLAWCTREPRFFIQPRILVKQVIDWTTRRLHVGYTEEELYNPQIAFNLLSNGKYSLKFLLAILNSILLTWYHKYRFLDVVKQRFQKILIQDAKSFPHPSNSLHYPSS